MFTSQAPPQVMYYKHGNCDMTAFDAALSNGVPFCVEDAHTPLQGEWQLQAFIQRHGPLPVTPVDCLTGKDAVGKWNVETLFGVIARGDTSHGTLKLKVSCLVYEDASVSRFPRTGHRRTILMRCWAL